MKNSAIAGGTSRPKSGSAKPATRKGNEAVEAQACEMNVRRMVETEAYLRAERRGFAAGAELDDWLDAEAEVSRMLAAGSWSAN